MKYIGNCAKCGVSCSNAKMIRTLNGTNNRARPIPINIDKLSLPSYSTINNRLCELCYRSLVKQSRRLNEANDLLNLVNNSDNNITKNNNHVNKDEDDKNIITLIYTIFRQQCDLSNGTGNLLTNFISTKRKSRPPSSAMESSTIEYSNIVKRNREIVGFIPKTVCTTYGEATQSGFAKVLFVMMNCSSVDNSLRLNSQSTFLDIGSGFGKCVIHAKIYANVARSIGIEFSSVRHHKATETLNHLKSIEDSRLSQLDWYGIHLLHGDATDESFMPYIELSSHIYMYDKLSDAFQVETMFKVVNQSGFKMLASFQSPRILEQLGLTMLRQVEQIPVQTTGHESFTCYFYVKDNSVNK